MSYVRRNQVIIEIGPCRIKASGAFAIVIVALAAGVRPKPNFESLTFGGTRKCP